MIWDVIYNSSRKGIIIRVGKVLCLFEIWNIYMELMSSARHSSIIQVDQCPPTIGMHQLKDGLYGNPSRRKRAI